MILLLIFCLHPSVCQSGGGGGGPILRGGGGPYLSSGGGGGGGGGGPIILGGPYCPLSIIGGGGIIPYVSPPVSAAMSFIPGVPPVEGTFGGSCDDSI